MLEHIRQVLECHHLANAACVSLECSALEQESRPAICLGWGHINQKWARPIAAYARPVHSKQVWGRHRRPIAAFVGPGHSRHSQGQPLLQYAFNAIEEHIRPGLAFHRLLTAACVALAPTRRGLGLCLSWIAADALQVHIRQDLGQYLPISAFNVELGRIRLVLA